LPGAACEFGQDGLELWKGEWCLAGEVQEVGRGSVCCRCRAGVRGGGTEARRRQEVHAAAGGRKRLWLPADVAAGGRKEGERELG
jgi:hypothetical protein